MQNIRSKSSNVAAQRRIVVSAVVVSMALSGVWAPRLVADTSQDAQATIHVVGQGDTLWGVARLHASERNDPRAFIDRVRRLNDLSTAELSPGQELRLPPRD
ncbi:MAG: LysM peptidoglycan-binding domain-containing protein [Actinomycetota bacterium]